MKVISIGNPKREVFKRDFRVHAFYSISILGNLEKEKFYEVLSTIGYQKDQSNDFLVSENGITVTIDGNSFVLIFNPDILHHDKRIFESVNFIKKLKEAEFDMSILSVSVVNINRYIITQFEDNKNNRKSAIDYFFKGLDGEETAVYYLNNDVSALRIYFEQREGSEYNMDFSISSTNTDKNGVNEDLNTLFSRLEDNCYRMWRTIVPKRVLDVMKKD